MRLSALRGQTWTHAIDRAVRGADFGHAGEEKRSFLAFSMMRRHSLTTLLTIFAILTTGILATGCLLYRSQEESCRREAEHKLAAVVDLKVSDISAWPRNVWPTPPSSMRTTPSPIW